eukprot:scaffold50939_cov33-Tisochrysis_lutea.AAC.1
MAEHVAVSETSPYPISASDVAAAAPQPEAHSAARPDAEPDAPDRPSDLGAQAADAASEEENQEEKTQIASIMRSMSWVRGCHLGQGPRAVCAGLMLPLPCILAVPLTLNVHAHALRGRLSTNKGWEMAGQMLASGQTAGMLPRWITARMQWGSSSG